MAAQQTSLGKKIALWAGSFLVMASLAVYYLHMPLAPIVVAGIMTLVVTLVRHFASKN